jgi:hypothetical protein
MKPMMENGKKSPRKIVCTQIIYTLPSGVCAYHLSWGIAATRLFGCGYVEFSDRRLRDMSQHC